MLGLPKIEMGVKINIKKRTIKCLLREMALTRALLNHLTIQEILEM